MKQRVEDAHSRLKAVRQKTLEENFISRTRHAVSLTKHRVGPPRWRVAVLRA